MKTKPQQQQQLEAYQRAWACEILGKVVESFDIVDGEIVVFLNDPKTDRAIEARVAPMPAPERGPR